jgi:hypothetical protein
MLHKIDDLPQLIMLVLHVSQYTRRREMNTSDALGLSGLTLALVAAIIALWQGYLLRNQLQQSQRGLCKTPVITSLRIITRDVQKADDMPQQVIGNGFSSR